MSLNTHTRQREQRRRFEPDLLLRKSGECGDLCFEVILDRRHHPEIFFAVVQRGSSPEVLFLGQFYSRNAAESAAAQFISDYIRAR